ncbi:MAG: OB-fold domain-containing protein [Chloroflexi bacterium]|nr:OB-fold domain-containing protein [Chloroflexota bacterium]
MTEKRQVPIEKGLFTWPSDKPQLIGGRCKGCGVYFFPKFYIVHKPGCKDRQVEEVLLSRRGKLDTYTIQYYPPPPPFITPVPFVPYAVGWVALPEGICVAGIITGWKFEDIKTHTDMELVVEKFWDDPEENEVVSWKWRPVKGAK